MAALEAVESALLLGPTFEDVVFVVFVVLVVVFDSSLPKIKKVNHIK